MKFVTATLRRLPFTIVMAAIVAAVAVATATHLGRLEPALLRRLGFAPLHLDAGEVVRLVTSAFLTAGGAAFYRSFAMLAACLGWAEWRLGTWRTAIAFWGVHLATLLLESFALAIPFHRLNVWWGKLLATELDVGPSAGYYGCLGMAVCSLAPGRRRWLGLAVLGILIARLIWTILSGPGRHGPLSADVAHLIAFPLGIAAGRWVVRK